MVWPMEGYTDKLHFAVKYTFESSPLPFTVAQVVDRIRAGYSWLTLETEQQRTLLNKIVRTGITKLTQQGKLKKVHSTVTVDPQWIWARSPYAEGYQDITGVDNVAHTEAARKALNRRALGGQTLWRLNQVEAPKFAVAA